MKNALINRIQPYGARLITSAAVLNIKRALHEGKRKVLAQPHHVDVFLRINDPYSYLLVQVMADFVARFDIQVRYRTIQHLQEDMYPEEEMWHQNGFVDAMHLAKLYQLQWPLQSFKHRSENRMALVNQGTERLLQLELAQATQETIDWSAVEQVFHDYWFQDADADRVDTLTDQQAPIVNRVALDRQLASNERFLIEKGHYMSAMLHYAGEWYWGLDRLDHLEKRLNALGLANTDECIVFDRTYADVCAGKPLSVPHAQAKKLTLFFSIRSPYSHLALVQALKLAQHYQLTIEIKPVLPMLMRGLLVPDTKKMYIFHDTKREANKLGIDYGYVADPLGKGVEHCYTLFEYAKSLGKENNYLLQYAQAVNAQGIHSETYQGLEVIAKRSGLDWSHCLSLLQQPDANEKWQIWAEENRQEMVALGSWGVPTFQYGDCVLWGQDRAGLIELAIKEDIANSE